MPILLPSAAKLFELNALGRPQIERTPESLYAFGSLIRRAEELLLQLFSQGLLSGTTHTCIGQEFCAMSVVRALTHPEDAVLSNHRNHGHFLTYSGDFLGLIAEIMGRAAGVCNGVGGSQHIAYRHFHSNGVQGGMTAIGVGHALALKRRGRGGIVATIIGDGTLGEGLVYESLNLAGLWEVPILFVVENNGIAQTTSTVDALAGSIEARGAAFGLPAWRFNDADPDFFEQVEEVVEHVRSSGRPGFLVLDTVRLGPHSKGDDLRDAAAMEAARQRDPLIQTGRELNADDRAAIDEACKDFMHQVHTQALASPESHSPLSGRSIFRNSGATLQPQMIPVAPESVRSSLNRALANLLTADPQVLILGEDLHDPYGGAFKVTAGLSSRFPQRVISTPISEAAITGAAIGLALSGFRPLVEIMFADFSTLVMDQIYNHAVKFPGMFADAQIPLVVRTPSGGRRGYGPTHSQSMENLMCAVPGLTVVFPSIRHNPGELLRRAVSAWPYPTFFFEHKLMYGRTIDATGYTDLAPDPQDAAAELFPAVVRAVSDPDVCLVAVGDAVSLAEAVAAQLAEEEVQVEILIPSLLAPLPRHTLVAHLLPLPRIVVVEEAPGACGFSSELAAALLEAGYRGTFRRVAPPPVPIPAARSLELEVFPSERHLFDTVVESILADLA